MISNIRGSIDEKGEDRVVVDVSGIGFEIFMPASEISGLPAEGENIKLYTYMSVREDAMLLYGFSDKRSLEMFKLLITVNSVGPKAALSIIGEIGTDGLVSAVISDDEKSISKAPGIGSKTAKRIILDLKDKIDFEEAYAERLDDGSDEQKALRSEAAQVLVALGYSRTQAHKALDGIELSEDITVDRLVSQALRLMSPI